MSGKSRMVFALLAIILIGYFVYSRMYDGKINITYGAAELKYKAFTEDLNITGPTTFTDIKVDANTKILGPVTDSKGGTFKSLEIEGPAEMYVVTATNFTLTGPLNCTKCTFESASITGPATLTESSVPDLSVTGPLSADNLTVSNSAKVLGPVNAKNSTFNKLELNATESTFQDSKITDLVIAADESNRKQVVELSGSTTVENDITFNSGIGEVIVRGDSVKIKGIVGGTLKTDAEATTPLTPMPAAPEAAPEATAPVTPTPAAPVTATEAAPVTEGKK